MRPPEAKPGVDGEAYYDEGFRDVRFNTLKMLGARNLSKRTVIEVDGDKKQRKVFIVEYETDDPEPEAKVEPVN